MAGTHFKGPVYVNGREVSTLNRVGLIILGQSNEGGKGEQTQRATYPAAFFSQRVDSVTSCLTAAPGRGRQPRAQDTTDRHSYPQGSMWPTVFDSLYDSGVWLEMRNCSVGSMSFVSDVAQTPFTRSASYNSVNYLYGSRPPTNGVGDYGEKGMCIVVSISATNYVFQLTTGSVRYAWIENSSGQITSPAGELLDTFRNELYQPTADKKTTAASPPDFSAASATGATVADGDCVWTNRGPASSLNVSSGTPLTDRHIYANSLNAFDRLGILQRCLDAVDDLKRAGCERIILYFCNGQGDISQTAANYAAVLQSMAYYVRACENIDIMIGLSCYKLLDSTTNWDNLSTGVTTAISALGGTASRIYAGANLYQLMGTTEGANGLTYGTSSNAGVHLDCPGLITAGGHHAAAIKAALGLT